MFSFHVLHVSTLLHTCYLRLEVIRYLILIPKSLYVIVSSAFSLHHLYLYFLIVFVFHVSHVSPLLHTCHLRLEASRYHRKDHKAATIAVKYIIPNPSHCKQKYQKIVTNMLDYFTNDGFFSERRKKSLATPDAKIINDGYIF